MSTPYPWLTLEDDGSIGIDMADTTPAEMDRRMVIAQELRSGRLLLNEEFREEGSE